MRNVKRIISELHSDEPQITGSEVDSPTELSHCQWSVLPNHEFAPSLITVKKVPAGLYEIVWNSSMQSTVMKRQDFNVDELYELPSPEIQQIIEDIRIFWERRDTYREYNFVHKRGILLWGEPGCGKSGIIQICIKKLIENENGIVINIRDTDDFKSFVEMIPTIRRIEPDRPLIVILEDIDSLGGDDNYSTTKLLNILDGVKQVESVVYIATTNYPEKLAERLTNRPSRFDRRYQVEMPSKEIREAYLRRKLSDSDISGIDLQRWINESEGMSLSHLKELVISVIVMCKSFEEAISSLSEMKKSPKIKRSTKLGFGS
jgi:SpoVK/Ycf46/Vps4 family AAA+-type ATPase